ncbi:MAG: 50S ribosomal protein L11 [Candidatus Andersenbacteria bacterium CG10_big_fil_rev_8_21_14_0_10_54_11]|uniref:Large ribosomal subunit protein uL11 n=1 Tax=Candidatus Andersenbacteria bacterium CG10_big_fil_rev_8_21_14_0_10_54_11 TaxID=1974485 RepID=A0A2M6WYW6_9BACT|nr:MAG: 50S ribosomal protein L11 [Candidatus Andersenbacteria bacterium CG10_big_fil_rev_8_21_14_0_10_54_11]
MPQVVTKFKVQALGGKATPAPPLGPVLGQQGINIQEFITRFNDMTAEMAGDIVPAEVTVYDDRSFSLLLKTPPAAELLKKAAKVGKGSGKPNLEKVGTVTKAQVREIAERKLADLSARDLEAAVKIIEGTARSMGVTIAG